MTTVGPWRPESSEEKSSGRRRPLFKRSESGRSDTTLESPMVRNRLTSRVRIAEGLVILMVTLLLFGFWRLQVVHATHYLELAENNRRRNLVVRAPRGLISDRNGQLMAANRAAFNVAIVREELEDRDATLSWLAGVLGITPEVLIERLEARQSGLPIFQPVVIADDINQALVAAIESRSREFPGVIIQPEHKRHYPKGLVAAHVLGQVGEINREQLDAWEQGRYRSGDIVGRNGVERVYNDSLAGFAGDERVLVNSAGRTVRVIDQRPPYPGNALTLTLDLAAQQHAEALLQGKRGAIVMIDVATGGVLALASAPTYDPNMFARRFSLGEWDALQSDPLRPLQNRALSSSFPPGSIFKLLVAVAALERGMVTPETTVQCNGGGIFNGEYKRCNAAHGTVDLEHAIGRSCNIYFYDIAERLGNNIEPIVSTAQRFGLGSRTGIDLLAEGDGILPTEEWIAARPGADAGNWYPGETTVLSIGQGPIDTTPLQLANMAATLARGTAIPPHLIAHEEDPAGNPVAIDLPAPRPIQLDPAHRAAILKGMAYAASPIGTARRATSDIVAIGGKTGTAQVVAYGNTTGPEDELPEEFRDHAWFVGLAPIAAPEVAIAVFVEHGGGGGAAAAPLGGEILASYFARQYGVPEGDSSPEVPSTSGGGAPRAPDNPERDR